MFSRTVEYALRAAVWLAASPKKARTTREVSAATRVPTSYLSKVLQTLAESGLVNSQRGLGGGFVLSRPPERITVLEVVNAVDPILRIRACPLKLPSHSVRLCALHRQLDQALALVEGAFGDTTLADLLAESQDERPLCPVPVARLSAAGAGTVSANPPGRRPQKRSSKR